MRALHSKTSTQHGAFASQVSAIEKKGEKISYIFLFIKQQERNPWHQFVHIDL